MPRFSFKKLFNAKVTMKEGYIQDTASVVTKTDFKVNLVRIESQIVDTTSLITKAFFM